MMNRMTNRICYLILCIFGLFSILYSLEYYLIQYTNLTALGLYTFGVLIFVFGVRGVIRD
jgi:hypothetical protein